MDCLDNGGPPQGGPYRFYKVPFKKNIPQMNFILF